ACSRTRRTKYFGRLAQSNHSTAAQLAPRIRSAPLSRQSRSETRCAKRCRFSRCHAGAAHFVQRHFALRQSGQCHSGNSGITFVEMVERTQRRVTRSTELTRPGFARAESRSLLLSSAFKFPYSFRPIKPSVSGGSFFTSNNRYGSPSRFSISFQSRSRYIISSANSLLPNN